MRFPANLEEKAFVRRRCLTNLRFTLRESDGLCYNGNKLSGRQRARPIRTCKEDIMRKALKRILLVLLAIVVVAAAVFAGIYFTRFQTIGSIQKLTAYEDYNLYRMDVKYDYDLDKMLHACKADNQSTIDTLLREALPLLPISMKAPDFGCSAFTVKTADGQVLMGRNYDFKNNSSAMLVYCSPKNGYKSVATAALDNLSANQVDSVKSKLACLAAPFVCLDGVNEKGVSIAVLTLDSEPTVQSTGKDVLATTMVIRLVLDRAATTEEAVALISQYDVFATSGRDYHFYITDASGDGRAVEFDCMSEGREMVVTQVQAVTNFFAMYADQVLPDQHNGVYGHGRERFDRIAGVLAAAQDTATQDTAWEALKAAAQAPKEGDITSNTQWSIVYSNTDQTAEIVIRRDWDNITSYALAQ